MRRWASGREERPPGRVVEMLSDVAAERGVLAALFTFGGEFYDDIQGLICPSTFTVGLGEIIFSCLQVAIEGQSSGPIDLPTFLSAANGLGLSQYFQKKEDLGYLRAVMSLPVGSAKAAGRLAAKLKKFEIFRGLQAHYQQGLDRLGALRGDEALEEILAECENGILDYAGASLSGGQDKDKEIVLLGDLAEEYYQHLIDNPRTQIGISSGLPVWDWALGGGLRENSMPVVAARYKSGKSFYVDTVCMNVALQGIPVLNLDTEMSAEEHLCRVGAMLSQIPIVDIERGLPDFAHKQALLMDTAKKLKGIPYHYKCVTGEAVGDTISYVRRWLKRKVGLNQDGKANPCLVVYDYLKLMDYGAMSSSGLQEYQMLGYLTDSLKQIAKKYNICVLAMAQTNRDGINKEDTSVIAGSDRVGWFSTSITLMKEKDPSEIAEEYKLLGKETSKYTHKLIPMRSRHGPGVRKDDYINLSCDFSRATLKEGPLHSTLLKKANSNPQRDFLNTNDQF